jgi:carbon storage regulator CsrA
MLVITRRTDEAIVLKQEGRPPITIVICGVHGGKVRVGVDADESVRIRREELQ